MFGETAECELHGVSLEDQSGDTCPHRFEAAAIGDGDSDVQFGEFEHTYQHIGSRRSILVFWIPQSMW